MLFCESPQSESCTQQNKIGHLSGSYLLHSSSYCHAHAKPFSGSEYPQITASYTWHGSFIYQPLQNSLSAMQVKPTVSSNLLLAALKYPGARLASMQASLPRASSARPSHPHQLSPCSVSVAGLVITHRIFVSTAIYHSLYLMLCLLHHTTLDAPPIFPTTLVS